MKNYGDITKIDGHTVEPVDCVIGGSPCQNLSVAGNRKGLEGSESRLFLEQMRVIREMREVSNGQKPRYMVWENVSNALSCSKGKDFQRVLYECVFVAVTTQKEYLNGKVDKTDEKQKPRIPDVPVPKDGKWPNTGFLYDAMGRWSVAWRVHDAQYWGVAQRRRRIALVVDFGGLTAPEVLSECTSVSGDLDTCNTQGEGVAETFTGSINEPDRKCGIWDARGNGDGKLASTITGDHDNRITDYSHCVVEPSQESCVLESNQTHAKTCGDCVPRITEGSFSINGDAHESGVSIMSETSHALKTTTKEQVFVKSVQENLRQEARFEEVARPLTVDGGRQERSYPCICIGNGQAHVTEHYTEELSQTLNCMHDPMTIIEPTDKGCGCHPESSEHPITIDRAAFNQGQNALYVPHIEEDETMPTLVARGPHAVAAPVTYKVRRLTPIECTRLQGYPDGWVDIGDWVDSKGKKHKEADAPKYKALGNSIALPFWKWLCKNIVTELRKDSPVCPTMASLFDGIGGFPLCWSEATGKKESVSWISEIEEFPLAVTRHHFGS